MRPLLQGKIVYVCYDDGGKMKMVMRGILICAGGFGVISGLVAVMNGLVAMADTARVPNIPKPIEVASLEGSGELPSRHVQISRHLAYYPLAKGGTEKSGKFVVFYPIASEEAFQRIRQNQSFVGLKEGIEPMKLVAIVRTYRFKSAADIPQQPQPENQVVGIELDYNQEFDGTIYRNSLTSGSNVFSLRMRGVEFVDRISTIKENASPPSSMRGLLMALFGAGQIAVFGVMIYVGVKGWGDQPGEKKPK